MSDDYLFNRENFDYGDDRKPIRTISQDAVERRLALRECVEDYLAKGGEITEIPAKTEKLDPTKKSAYPTYGYTTN